MKKLVAVPAWMFGWELKEVDITLNEDGSGSYSYPTYIGCMAKPHVEKKEFDNYEKFLQVNNFRCVLHRASRYMSIPELREYNRRLSKIKAEDVQGMEDLKKDVMDLVRRKHKAGMLPLGESYGHYSYTWRNIKK